MLQFNFTVTAMSLDCHDYCCHWTIIILINIIMSLMLMFFVFVAAIIIIATSCLSCCNYSHPLSLSPSLLSCPHQNSQCGNPNYLSCRPTVTIVVIVFPCCHYVPRPPKCKYLGNSPIHKDVTFFQNHLTYPIMRTIIYASNTILGIYISMSLEQFIAKCSWVSFFTFRS